MDMHELRAAVVGVGRLGALHARKYANLAGVRLCFVADINSERARAVAAETGAVALSDHRAVVGKVDVATVAAPSLEHFTIARDLMLGGIDVLLEKPMAASIADCDRIVEAVRRTGRVLSVGHEFRVSTQWGLIRDLIRQGELGEPLYANVSLFRFPYRQGSGGWRYAEDRVGSWILEEPVHFFDMLMWWLAELGDPQTVQGFGNSRGGRRACTTISRPCCAGAVAPMRS